MAYDSEDSNRTGLRVASIFGFLTGIRGTITRDVGNFAYVKWDDPKYGETSEDFSVIVQEDYYEQHKEEFNRGA